MFAAESRTDAAAIDVLLEQRVCGVEPVRPRRPAGELYESAMLGRLEFFPMPFGRPSFWRGEQQMPDSRYPLRIVCEVEGDGLPGSDQAACVAAFRRSQIQDAMLSAPLINARLGELQPDRTIGFDDLVLTSIHLAPRPLVHARFELAFRAGALPHLLFTVVFTRGIARSVRIDSDA